MTPEQRFRAARWGYVAVVLLATLTQLHPSPDLTAAGARLARAFTPSLGWRDAIDGLRNTVLFAGLGAVWVVTSRSGAVRAEIRRATLVGLALSATVEGLQVFSPVRTASIVDVTTNTLGALGGAGAVALLIAAVVAAKGARSYLGVPSFLLAGAYGGAVLCEALTPLFGPAALPWTAGGAGAGTVVRVRRAAGALGLAPVPAPDGCARDRRSADARARGAPGVAGRAGGRVQRAARAAAVPLLSAARQHAGGLAAAPPGALGAPVAGRVALRRDRTGTYSHRRSHIRRDERPGGVCRARDRVDRGAALGVRALRGGAGARRRPLARPCSSLPSTRPWTTERLVIDYVRPWRYR